MNLSYDPNASGGNFKNAPAGAHNARICWIVDLGTQNERGFNGGPNKDVKRIKIFFELVDTNEVFKEGEGPKPFFMSKKYTKSLAGNSNNLRKDLVALGIQVIPGVPIDMRKLIGMPVFLNVILEFSKTDASKIYPKIAAIMPNPQGNNIRPLRNPTVFFDMDSPDAPAEYAKLNGKSLIESINMSPEFRALCQRTGLQPRTFQNQGVQQNQQQQGWNNQQQPQQNFQQQQFPPQPQQPPAWNNPAPPAQQNFQQQQPPVQQPWTPPAQPWQQNQPPTPVNPPAQPQNLNNPPQQQQFGQFGNPQVPFDQPPF